MFYSRLQEKLNSLSLRPLFLAASGVVFSFLLCSFLPMIAVAALAVIALAVGVLLCCKHNRAGIFSIAVLLGILYFTAYEFLIYMPADRLKGKEITLTGTVASAVVQTENAEYYTVYPQTITYLNDHPKILGKVVVYTKKGSTDLPVGATVRCSGTVFDEDTDEGERFDYRRTKGEFISLYTEKITKTAAPGDYNIFALTQKIRQRIDQIYKSIYTKETAAFLKGLTLGDKTDIEKDVITSFKYSGISHVLAVSGMHLAFLTGIIWSLLSVVHANLYVRSIIQLIVIWAFAAVTQFSPSCCRAAIMLSIYHIGILKNKESDSYTALSVAVALCCLPCPYSVLNPSLMLSSSSTFGILLLSGKISGAFSLHCKRFSFLGKLYNILKNSICMSVAATIFTMPVLIFFFQSISLSSPITNVLIIIPIEIMFTLALISLAFCWITPLYPIFSFCMQQMYDYCCAVTHLIEKLPTGMMYFADWHFWVFFLLLMAILIAIFLLSLRFEHFPKHGVAILSVLVLYGGLFASFYIPKNEVNVYFVSAGQGNTTLITANGSAVLIDCGGSGLGARSLEKTLMKAGVRNIEAMYFTHLDKDHIVYAPDLVKRYRPKKIVVPERSTYSEDGGKLLYTARSCGAQVDEVVYNQNDRVLDKATLEIFAEHAGISSEEENENSLVYRLTFGKTRVLFMGDLAGEGEEYLLMLEKDLQSDIIEIGHHGSATSSSEELLSASGAKYAVISVGKNNSYNLPSKKVLRRLKTMGFEIFRTDLDGTVAVSITPERYTIEKGY